MTKDYLTKLTKTLQDRNQCEECGGSGRRCNYEHVPGIDMCLKCKTCPSCNGTGQRKPAQ